MATDPIKVPLRPAIPAIDYSFAFMPISPKKKVPVDDRGVYSSRPMVGDIGLEPTTR
jgi:hypothetical protein